MADVNLRKTGVANALLATGSLTSGVIGHALRDKSEVKKFMKERYGDNYKPSIRQNEREKLLNRS